MWKRKKAFPYDDILEEVSHKPEKARRMEMRERKLGLKASSLPLRGYSNCKSNKENETI